MKIVIVNRSDQRGGAAIVSHRLGEALRNEGHQVSMVVWEKSGADSWVIPAASKYGKQIPFLLERLGIFIKTQFDRSTLFKIDTASCGLPLWRLPAIQEADAILLNWTNQGMLSLKGLRKLLSLGKPVVITMHDMWAFTGICHHSGNCRRYEKECGGCPLLRRVISDHDLSYRIWKRKMRVYSNSRSVEGSNKGEGKRSNLAFVAVSNWLGDRARSSSLLADFRVEVIPNAFDIGAEPEGPASRDENPETVILFGAARLDDPIKGHRILVKATRILNEWYPEQTAKMRLVTFGNLKDPNAFEGVGITHTHLGSVAPERLPELYRGAHVIVSASEYETLPGTLVEGQAYGAVPVAFEHGGQSDIISDFLTGRLVPWDDNPTIRAAYLAMGIKWAAECRNDKEMRVRMRQEVEARFSARQVAHRYEELINSMIEGTPHGLD